jgi:hypothetical protein
MLYVYSIYAFCLLSFHVKIERVDKRSGMPGVYHLHSVAECQAAIQAEALIDASELQAYTGHFLSCEVLS